MTIKLEQTESDNKNLLDIIRKLEEDNSTLLGRIETQMSNEKEEEEESQQLNNQLQLQLSQCNEHNSGLIEVIQQLES